jgi:hypothetical protein
MTKEEAAELQNEYNLHTANGGTVIQWLQQNPELTSYEHSIIVGYSARNIHEIRARHKLSKVYVIDTGDSYIRDEKVFVPLEEYHELTDEWVCRKWEEGFSLRKIGMMCYRRIETVKKRLIKLGYTITPRDTNPHMNESWLREHINKGYSLTQTAKIAGVTTSTITAWVYKFNLYAEAEEAYLAKEISDTAQTP